jgi:CubicO group peptidase (beta-lactamase class C family)
MSAVSVLAALAFTGSLAPANVVQAQRIEDSDDFAQQLSFALVRHARHLCAVIHVVGRTPEEAMSIGDITRWSRLVDWWDWDKVDINLDTNRKRVTLTRPPAPPRSAVFNGDQGCSMIPPGEDGIHFTPVAVPSNLPPADRTPWPMGDVTDGQIVRGINQAAVRAALDHIFADNDPEAGERGWVILHDGLIAGERYAPGYDKDTRNLNFSSGKSITSTLIGILVGDGHLNVKQPAPIAEWAAPDARSLITIENLLHMASGLACTSFPLTHPDHYTRQNHHFYAYFEGVNAFEEAASPLLLHLPGKVNRYRNCDNLVLGKIVRETVEKNYDIGYLQFPRRALFDRIGARSWVLETDPYGNFQLNGMSYASTRDWARVGLLYLQDGVFNGERILPAGWAAYVATPSPANAGYGAQWRIATARDSLPADAYWATGAEGQQTMVIPSHGLVIAKHAWDPAKDYNPLARMITAAVIGTQRDCANNGWRTYGFDGESECVAYVSRRGPIAR